MIIFEYYSKLLFTNFGSWVYFDNATAPYRAFDSIDFITMAYIGFAYYFYFKFYQKHKSFAFPGLFALWGTYFLVGSMVYHLSVIMFNLYSSRSILIDLRDSLVLISGLFLIGLVLLSIIKGVSLLRNRYKV